ncbi:DUF5082 family protein [Streptococcus pantholopis]|uniref:DUF5082 domain-containing protein n=1 Tax=Streptococcus pantholopis TaxID=1811193 RepID=A0A172Q4Z8_9STRE|nr:DUF5082 family protein [Streptococcus pantholopis]AND78526.1 hypothetical protein A0O21_00075 [Streptococcus pantholopis]AND78539.1 hypothetical protein A0O21_00140 [Streptococcus pantholopis]AND78550.1 hypothetical protein A0O21_00195 [Streptococcus pantholopis]
MSDAAMASYYDNLASQESANYASAIAEKGVVDGQIARLQEAETSLTSQITEFQTSIIDAFSTIEASDSSQFQGDRQTKYEEKYSSAQTAATTNKSSHDTNLSSIGTKISELETTSASLQSAANTAYNNMTSYTNQANSYRG